MILGGLAELESDSAYSIYLHDTTQEILEQQTVGLPPSSLSQMAVEVLWHSSLM